jgi:hypothetical protein
VTRYLALAAAVSAATLAVAAAVPASRPALLGAGISVATALASLAGFVLFGRSPGKPLQRALAVFVVMFLVRLVLVALGLVAVHRLGDDFVAFIVAFFVPYFAFAAIEGGLVHALGRSTGKTT